MATITYPHRLTFLGRGKCDVCGNKGKELIHTSTNRYFGWETCNEESCNEIIKTWYFQTTVSNEDLRNKFGDTVRILRRSGDEENDWEISGDAHRETKDGPLWVKVKNRNQHVTKEITIASLTEWNSPHTKKTGF